MAIGGCNNDLAEVRKSLSNVGRRRSWDLWSTGRTLNKIMCTETLDPLDLLGVLPVCVIWSGLFFHCRHNQVLGWLTIWLSVNHMLPHLSMQAAARDRSETFRWGVGYGRQCWPLVFYISKNVFCEIEKNPTTFLLLWKCDVYSVRVKILNHRSKKFYLYMM